MIGLVAWQRRREQRTVADQLPGFAMAGWIAPSEVALLSTLAGRNRWRRAVRQRSGKAAERAVTEYQTAVTELAFLRARMSRGAVGPQAWEWHNERLAALTAARARAMGQPEALTAAWLRPPPSGWAPPPPPPPGWRPNPSPPPGWTRPARGAPRPAAAPGARHAADARVYPGRRRVDGRGVGADECRPARPARRRRGVRRPRRRRRRCRAGRRRAPGRRRLRGLPRVGDAGPRRCCPACRWCPPDEAAAGADLVLLAVPGRRPRPAWSAVSRRRGASGRARSSCTRRERRASPCSTPPPRTACSRSPCTR